MNKTYFHHSKIEKDENDNLIVKPRVTVAGIIVDGNLHLGVSRCSIKDHFNKSKGRYISERRAGVRPSIIVKLPTEGEKGYIGKFFLSQAKQLIELTQSVVAIPRPLEDVVK